MMKNIVCWAIARLSTELTVFSSKTFCAHWGVQSNMNLKTRKSNIQSIIYTVYYMHEKLEAYWKQHFSNETVRTESGQERVFVLLFLVYHGAVKNNLCSCHWNCQVKMEAETTIIYCFSFKQMRKVECVFSKVSAYFVKNLNKTEKMWFICFSYWKTCKPLHTYSVHIILNTQSEPENITGTDSNNKTKAGIF